MDKKEAIIFAAQIGADIPELDLHGLYPTEALEKLELFLFANRDQAVLRIIYGGGTGKLGEAVLVYLREHPLVDDLVEEGGGCLVLI